MMCEFNEEGSRKKENISAITGIVLDVDGDNTDAELEAALEKLAPYVYALYTTFSHTAKSPCIRIVIPLKKPVTPKNYEANALALRTAQFLGIKVDDCSKNAAQFYYLPSKPSKEAESLIYANNATQFFPIDNLPALAKKKLVKSKSMSGKDGVEIYGEVKALVDGMLEGHAPYYVGDKFHFYAGGVWHPYDAGRLLTKEVVDHYQRTITLGKAEQLIDAMKTLHIVKSFPESDPDKITLANGTLSVTSFKLEPHSPENFHRAGMDFDYDRECEMRPVS